MSIPVVFPRRPDNGHRDMLWEFCRGKWEEHGYSPLIESDSDGEWSRGEAINRGVAQLPDARAFVVADCDVVFADWEQPRQAAQLALDTGSLAYAHRRHHMLPWEATQRMLAGAAPQPEWAEQAVDNTMSSCWAISREAWETIGGFDERFVEWGAEDWAWFAACGTLLGIERVENFSFHLWHPRDGEADHPHYAANIELGKRYMALQGDPDAMRAILAEPGGPLHDRVRADDVASNVGRWSGWHTNVKPFGAQASYELGVEWLKDCERIEDWGAGAGFFGTLVGEDRYVGVDGSEGPKTTVIADLTEYRSEVPGIFIRHVLEHNYEWAKILDNALSSFKERLVLVLFVPLSDGETYDTEWEDPPGVPNLSFRLEDVTDRMDRAGVKHEHEALGNEMPYGLREPKQVGTETVFRLSR